MRDEVMAAEVRFVRVTRTNSKGGNPNLLCLPLDMLPGFLFADSIRLHGVLEPIIVREIALTAYEGHGRQYELIAGERRWRAAIRAQLEAIPALVLPETTSDQSALELAITENLQREDLHPLDAALAFGRMQRELGYSYAQIADRLGKSKGYVQNRLRLLQLDEELQLLVAERPDTLSHVYELAKLKQIEQRRALIEAVRTDMLSFAETRARVQALLTAAEDALPPLPSSEVGEAESYLHRYDSDTIHNKQHQSALPQPAAPTAFLRTEERAALRAVLARMEQGDTVPNGTDLALLQQLAALVHTLPRDA
jgi:ParB/RepB/Spo0J family partition protein